MCDNCEEKDLDNIENEEFLESSGYSEGSYENSFLSPIEIPLEVYDMDKFNKGIENFSELAGKLTALINVGIHPSEALGYIMNQENIKHGEVVAMITKDMNVEISKNQVINMEKNQM